MPETAFQLTDVSFRYDGDALLSGIDLELPAGKFSGILGPNGAGKSTLLRLLSGALQPQTGCVSLFGQDLAKMSIRERALKMARVSQHSGLAFDFTVLDTVLMGRSPHIDRLGRERASDYTIAREALAQMHIEYMSDRLVTTLSGGEWQRVTVARALAQQTEVLLLDEPTASLDIGHQVQTLALMKRLTREKGKTVICVLHDMNLAAQFCDELVLLSAGHIAKKGAPESVLDAGLLSEVYQISLTKMMHPESGKPMIMPCYSATDAVS